MEEILRCRMKNWDTAVPMGECVLERSGQQLRARLRLPGVAGLAEWYLFSARGEAVCAHAESVQGQFVCDRGMAWMAELPAVTVVLLDAKPVAFSGDRALVTREKLQPLLRAAPAVREIQEQLSPQTQQAPMQPLAEEVPCEPETVQAETPCEPEAVQAETPCEPEEPESADAQMPAQAVQTEEIVPQAGGPAGVLPWALDAASIDRALQTGEAFSPFPGMLEGACFVRLPLGEVEGADHYVAGKIPLMESAAYYLVGIPAPPEGVAHGAARDFTHYLPSREGSGYWVKYLRG